MAFSISSFRANALAKNGARANLFEVNLTGAAVNGFGLGVPELTFACKAAQIPSSSVGVVEVPYFGRVVKIPGNKTFENWTVTIINDEDFTLRNGFESWIAAMGTHEGNISTVSAGAGTLYGTGVVNQLAQTGGTTALASYSFIVQVPPFRHGLAGSLQTVVEGSASGGCSLLHMSKACVQMPSTASSVKVNFESPVHCVFIAFITVLQSTSHNVGRPF